MRLAQAVGLAVLVVACSNADKEASSRRSPKLPPPPTLTIPAGIDIPVLLDGAAAPSVTTARLEAAPPEFADADRRAWRLDHLLAVPDGATIDAVSSEQVAVSMTTTGGLVPVLFVTRRGDAIATLVDPKDPFPQFHGQGGRLKRPGDTTPRVSPVIRFEIRAKR